MRALIALISSLCLVIGAHAALRPGTGTGPTTPTPTTDQPGQPVTSWQPPVSLFRW